MDVHAADQNRESLYRALVTRDARFDGEVFYGIHTTGIYCRPVCPARTPRFSNCSFFRSAAAAQHAGFRPCLRCRPETAPQCAAWKGTSTTVARSLALIDEGALDGPGASVEALANRVGMGERQLRRLFLQHLGASPISVAQTRRVLFAKQLLHDTQLPMRAVAEAAGFGSERRFHEVFQTVFKRPPTAIRRAAASDVASAEDDVVLRVRYRAPYNWSATLRTLAQRCTPGVDSVEADSYRRAQSKGAHACHIKVTHDEKRSSLLVRVHTPSIRQLPFVLARVRRLFDTDADIFRIGDDLSADSMLRPLVQRHPGFRVPGSWEPTDHEAGSLDAWHPSPRLLQRVASLDPTVNSPEALLERSHSWRPWQAYAEHLLLASGETE